jgi:tetratricopeptide (TPR) repeat protein
MFTTRFNTRTIRHDEVLWLVVAALVVLLILALARGTPVAVGQINTVAPPKMLADVATTWEAAIVDYRAGRPLDTAIGLEVITCELYNGRNFGPGTDPGLLVWNVLATHRLGRFDRVIEPWKEIPLAPNASGYRRFALAAIYLENGELENAYVELNAAREVLPNNPLVHYYMALYRLGQAARSRDSPDCIGPSKIRFVSFGSSERSSMTASAYELAAANELEEALTLLGTFDRNLPLVAANDTAEPELRATVNDLLVALSADRWEGNAHNMLGAHYLTRGTADEAEIHLDAAVKHGANVLYGFHELTTLFVSQGRYGDAVRADVKAIATSPAKVTELYTLYGHLRKAIAED